MRTQKRIVLFVLLIFLINFVINVADVKAETWIKVLDSSVGQIKTLEVYNGKLYAGGMTGMSNGHLFVYDGSAWTDLNMATAVGTTLEMIESMQVFNGKLFIGTRVSVASVKYSNVYAYDGMNFSFEFSAPGNASYSGIENLCVHNNNLYAANGNKYDGKVYQRISQGSWTPLGSFVYQPTGDAGVRALASFKGDLYASAGALSAIVWKWTGSNWVLSENLSTLLGLDNSSSIWSMANNDNYLFAGTSSWFTTTKIPVFNGISWSSSKSVAQNVRLKTIGDIIWACAGDGKVYFNNGTWIDAGTLPSSNAMDFEYFNGYVYAGTLDGKIYRYGTISPAWTLMYYVAGDNDLDVDLINEVKSITSANLKQGVNVTLFHDSKSQGASYNVLTYPGIELKIDKGSMNSGDSATLADFINWSKTNYPAAHYALIISDHGHALGGVAYDYSSGNKFITPKGIREALTQKGAIDILYMNACLMGNLDIAYELRGLVDYYIASESPIIGPNSHLPYLSRISTTTTALDLAKDMASTYNTLRQEPSSLSVVDMAYVELVAQKASSLANIVRNNWFIVAPQVWDIMTRGDLQRFDENIDGVIDTTDRLADLYHFAELTEVIPELQNAANALLSTKGLFVIDNLPREGEFTDNGITYQWNHENARGVTITLPTSGQSFYWLLWLDFAEGADWTGSTRSDPTREDGLEWGALVSELVLEFNPLAPDNPAPPDPIAPFISYYAFLPFLMH